VESMADFLSESAKSNHSQHCDKPPKTAGYVR
jgi:hypothetical protein